MSVAESNHALGSVRDDFNNAAFPAEAFADGAMRGRQPVQLKPECKKTVTIAVDATNPETSLAAPTTITGHGIASGIASYLGEINSSLSEMFSWVGRNGSWEKIKPVIRCAVVSWFSAVLFFIPKVHFFMGQTGFLILIASFLSPPSDPFISMIEREALILTMIGISLSWASLGIFTSSLARRVHDPNVDIFQAVSGQYIEAAPSIILGIFLFVGTTFFLYVKARQGPGPYAFACFSACLCLDICLTTAVLFPYPFYMIVRSTALPYIFHSVVALVVSPFIFPVTITTVFHSNLLDVIHPLIDSLDLHERLLETSITSPSFLEHLATLRSATKKSESNLTPLGLSGRLLKTDLAFCRFAPTDFKSFQATSRRLSGTADGLLVYFGLIDPSRERLAYKAEMANHGEVDGTPVPTAPQTPRTMLSRTTSRTSINDAEHSPHKARGSRAASSVQHSQRITINVGPTSSPATPSPTLVVSPAHDFPNGTSYPPSPPEPEPSPTSPTVASHHHYTASTSGHKNHHHREPHNYHRHLHLLHNSLLSLAKAGAKKKERAVGMFELQRYLDLERTKLRDPHEATHTDDAMELLRESCVPVLAASKSGISQVANWISTVHCGRLSQTRDMILLAFLGPGLALGRQAEMSQARGLKEHSRRLTELERVRDELVVALSRFKKETRHLVLEPYRDAFEDTHRKHQHSTSYPATPPSESCLEEMLHEGRVPGTPDMDSSKYANDELRYSTRQDSDSERLKKVPPHRYLFNSYVYQYHLMRMGSIVVEMLDEILRLETERPWAQLRLWTPVERLFKWNQESMADSDSPADGDDDPDVIQGLHYDSSESQHRSRGPLSSAEDSHFHLETNHRRHRDPDALPPRNFVEWVFSALHKSIISAGGGNVVFAIKGGIIAVLLALPSLIMHTSTFAYDNRFVWAIFMSQLTLNRFRGDTMFEFVVRLLVTLGGGCTGMVVWYISRGNPYGLAAVCAVCFPFFFFARLYWPIPPMTKAIFFVTTTLVIGYSYQFTLMELPGLPGTGWAVAWRRFVLVSAGVTAAFIVSFLPPSTTIRGYQPLVLASTASKLGLLYCSILSFAHARPTDDPEPQEIYSGLVAVRSRLKKSNMQRSRVSYEMSLRGRWPARRYQKIADLQMSIAYSLSNFLSVLRHLEPAWSRALMSRTRFMDPNFQGDVLAVISMISSALRTGDALPQITPSPLLDRFMLQYHGLNVIHKESVEDYGLPRTLTLKTLKDEQYLMFCVGISTAYGIVNRLDKLMIAVKEVVGEQYHIYGIDVEQTRLLPHGNSLTANQW